MIPKIDGIFTVLVSLCLSVCLSVNLSFSTDGQTVILKIDGIFTVLVSLSVCLSVCLYVCLRILLIINCLTAAALHCNTVAVVMVMFHNSSAGYTL